MRSYPRAFSVAFLLIVVSMLGGCGGGSNGSNGTDGVNALVKLVTEPAGSNCAYGGTLVETGLDTNRNGTLDSGEVDTSQNSYVCNKTGSFTIGGSVTGLASDGSQSVTLQDLGADDQMMSLDGTFTFATPLATGGRYDVAVSTQPTGRRCEFQNYRDTISGTVQFADITNLALTCYQNAQVITFAGDGTAGYRDATGTAAEFQHPFGVAVDNSGNVYVADSDGQDIRKISPAGVVTTLAGDGTPGYKDAIGTAAEFSYPYGVAVDAIGNVYVADTFNNRIRQISPAGLVTTLAGDGSANYKDATGTAAELNGPNGVAVDAGGNVYVADTANQRIRKITSDGVVTTLAGDGSAGYVDNSTGTSAEFDYPGGLAVDSSGNIYVADTFNNCIREISPSTSVTTLAGTCGSSHGYSDGPAATALFYQPTGVAVDSSGNVYVADFDNTRIRMISPAGDVTTLAGDGAFKYKDGIGTAAELNQPTGVAVDANGTLYVADYNNHRIRKIYQVP